LLDACAEVSTNEEAINSKIAENWNNHQQSQAFKYKTKSEEERQAFIWKSCGGENCPFYEEQKYLGNWPPKLGLSLSGGGTRSASFSVGVLKALHELEILNKVDVISSVSGGSYANYWYMSQNFYMEKINENHPSENYEETSIFRVKHEFLTSKYPGLTNLESPNNYRFQLALEESSNILDYRHDKSYTAQIAVGLQYAFETLFQLISTPTYWLTNSLFDWELNMTPFFYFYKDGLDRTYGYVPLDYSLVDFANSRRQMLTKNIDAEPILMGDMAQFFEKIKRNGIHKPYFVINTTGVLDAEFAGSFTGKKLPDKEDTENRIFEFTPWRCHFKPFGGNGSRSDCFEFRINHPTGIGPLDFARIITISGAAVDGKMQDLDANGIPEKPGLKSWLLDKFLDVVHFNLGYHLDNPKAAKSRWLFHKALPLPFYLMDDALSDENTTSGIYLTDGGQSENLGALSLIRRGVEEIIIVDAEVDETSIFEAAKRLNNALKTNGYVLNLKQPFPIRVKNADYSVIDGNISCLDKSHEDCNYKASVTYIKLSVKPRHEERAETIPRQEKPAEIKSQANLQYPYSVRHYMEYNPEYPHDSTADVRYSEEQFSAYRDLGYKLTLCKYDENTCQHADHYHQDLK